MVVFQSAPGHRRAEYCNERVCLSTRLLVSRTTSSAFATFSLHVTRGRCSFSRCVAIRYVLPVVWMFVRNRPGEGHTSRRYTQSDSPVGSIVRGAESDVYTIGVFVHWYAVTGRKRRADKLLMRLCPVGVAAPAWHADSDCSCCPDSYSKQNPSD